VRPCEVDRRKELLTGASGTPYDYFLEQLGSEGGLRTSGSPASCQPSAIKERT
jgi:hypothetical protein